MASGFLVACACAAGVDATPTWTTLDVLHGTATRLRATLNTIGPERNISDPRIVGLISLARQAADEAGVGAGEAIEGSHSLRQAQLLAKALGVFIPDAELQAGGQAVLQARNRRPGNNGRVLVAPKTAGQAIDIFLKYVERDVELGKRVDHEKAVVSRIEQENAKRLRYQRTSAYNRERKLSAAAASIAPAPPPAVVPPPPLPPALPARVLVAPPAPAVIYQTQGSTPQVRGVPVRNGVLMPAGVGAGAVGTNGLVAGTTGPGIGLRPPGNLTGGPHVAAAAAAAAASYYEQQAVNSRRILLEQQQREKALAQASAVTINPAEVAAEQAAYAALLAEDSFMAPLHHHFGPVIGKPDRTAAQTLRAVLAERERALYRYNQERQAELAAEPHDLPDDYRRKAIIEGKGLRLIELQRVVRFRVVTEDRKLLADPVTHINTTGPGSLIPYDDLSRLFHRREPPVYSYTDGYIRANILDGTRAPPARPLEIIAKECCNMAKFDRQRMEKQKVERHRLFLARLVTHHANFNTFHGHIWAARNRVLKGFTRHFVERKKAEERRKKQEQVERLRLLRSNDEDAYMQLLKNTKNERLLQLVKQTDSYMQAIGAKVAKTREPARSVVPTIEEGDGRDSNDVGAGTDTVDTMRSRRSAYYTVTHRVTEEVRQPSIMVNGTLKPYQIDGLRWMVSLYNNNLNGILADEMGLGKTIQTISLITYLIEMKSNPGPYLVIVPLSTLGNWVREFEKWAPSVIKVIYRGDATTRKNIEIYEIGLGRFNVLLTTYEFVVRDQHVLSRISWKYIIIDEGHRMKNANSKMAMTLGLVYRSRNRLLLTGTPLQNNLTELWALLNFLLPTIFSSADTFEQWFKKPFEQTTMGDTAELEEEETYLIINRLHQVLRPFLLRRLKTDVESQLPDKVETVIRCDMSSWQRVIYRQMQNKISVATGEEGGNGRRFNNLIMQLKKICNHPFIFYQSDEIAKLPDEMLIRSSGKFCLLAHVLAKFKHANHRTLIFSQMTTALDYMEDFLCAIGIQYLRLDGSTKADERQDMLNEFNAPDSPYFCFLLSTRAGGLGLNLQSADTVIIFDSDWNPMMDLQAQDRAHRIGQKHEVRVIRLISAGTIEVKILDQANRKLHIDAQVIQAGQFNNKATDTDRETMLKSILKQQSDESDKMGDRCPDKEEVNRMIARSDEEFEMYQKIDLDRASKEHAVNEEMVEDESELPSWVLKPEVDFKTTEEKEKEALETYGRGRRKRSDVVDTNQLTEKEWMEVMEGELTLEEALDRKKQRIARRRRLVTVDLNSDAESHGGKDGEAKMTSEEEDSDNSLSRAVSSRRRSSRRATGKRRRSNGVAHGDEEVGANVKRRRMNGSTPVPAAPRSRARPPRGARAAAVLENADEEDDRSLIDSKRKSRRRSVPISGAAKKASIPTPKRGRGRPRKVIAPPVESEDDMDVSIMAMDRSNEGGGAGIETSIEPDGEDIKSGTTLNGKKERGADAGNDDETDGGAEDVQDNGGEVNGDFGHGNGGGMRTRLRLRVRPLSGKK